MSPPPDDRMTARELATSLADDFHDWIDGDDTVTDAVVFHIDTAESQVSVVFESGAAFNITVKAAT